MAGDPFAQRRRTNNRLEEFEIADRQQAGRLILLRKCGFNGRWLFVSAAIIFLPVCDAAAGGLELPDRAGDSLSLYGPVIEFDVIRKGDKVGFHQVRFERADEDLVVSSTFQIKIKVLFVTAFQYLYQSEGRWRQGQLVSLKADVNDGGKSMSVEAIRQGGRVAVTNAGGHFAVDAPLFPTNHWNAAVLPETQVLNTLTGRINNVRIEPRGREEVSTEWGDITATRYAYTGDLAAEVWYDDVGRWVKMRFKGRDGSVIEYVCRRCQGPAVKHAQR
jgi:hypothetical protein